MTDESIPIEKKQHHERHELCTTRPLYRQGRKLTAVKVYTVNEESQHLLIRGVPAINLNRELKNLCLRYGELKLLKKVENYSNEEEQFTDVYHVAYKRIQSARFAKHMIDDKSFFGGVLHACYAPELETLSETKYKLDQRRWDIAKRLRNQSNKSESTSSASQEPCEESGSNLSVPCSSKSYFTSNEIVGQSGENLGNFHTAAGLIESRFIPKQATSVPSNAFSNSTNDSITSIPIPSSSTADKLTSSIVTQQNKRESPFVGKFIPPQVKRIKFTKDKL